MKCLIVITMKILVLDGTFETSDSVTAILDHFGILAQQNSWILEVLTLRDLDISYCRGCFGCWVQTPGECIIKDDSPQISRKIINSDIVVYLTPIVFGAYSPYLKVALDRSICLVHPFFKKINGEYHHRKRYDHYASILGIGLLPSPDPELEEIFKRNVIRNALNMHASSAHVQIVYTNGAQGPLHLDIPSIIPAKEVIQ